jgi:threonylcarbamoyladenosine tRNA methylthiotransferase MtaB
MSLLQTSFTKKRISFFTFGCRLNQAETSSIETSFRENGYQIVGSDEDSDILVINTCTVTENGDADTRKMVRKIARKNPQTDIALLGCQAQLQGSKLLELPNIKWVIGNAKKMDLMAIISNNLTPEIPVVNVESIPRDEFRVKHNSADQKRTRANLKIQDGCDSYCFFCVIPYVRGAARSREFNDLIREAKDLSAADIKEIVLTGVNIGCYESKNKRFMDIIDSIESISGLQRLRISSIEPTTVPVSILNRMHADSVLCRHLHIPLQSGSDHLLFKMNRKYTIHEYKHFVDLAHRQVDDLCIGTDIIVGYPGETDCFFDESYDFLEQTPFAYIHVFSYSERDKAKSSKLDAKKVSPKIIKKRSRLLRELSKFKRETFMRQLLGKTEMVLFEQKKNGLWSGLTDHYVRVKVESNFDLQNQFLPVILNRIEGETVIGNLDPGQKGIAATRPFRLRSI